MRGPHASQTSIVTTTAADSTNGYCGEMGSPQLPASAPQQIQLRIGMLSYHSICFSQDGQKLRRGCETDSPRGSR